VPTKDRQAGEAGPAMVNRVNIALTEQAAQALAQLQEQTGLKKVDIVNRALRVYGFVYDEMRKGNELVVRNPQGSEQVVKIF
jgi:hypothetical protein